MSGQTSGGPQRANTPEPNIESQPSYHSKDTQPSLDDLSSRPTHKSNPSSYYPVSALSGSSSKKAKEEADDKKKKKKSKKSKKTKKDKEKKKKKSLENEESASTDGDIETSKISVEDRKSVEKASTEASRKDNASSRFVSEGFIMLEKQL